MPHLLKKTMKPIEALEIDAALKAIAKEFGLVLNETFRVKDGFAFIDGMDVFGKRDIDASKLGRELFKAAAALRTVVSVTVVLPALPPEKFADERDFIRSVVAGGGAVARRTNGKNFHDYVDLCQERLDSINIQGAEPKIQPQVGEQLDAKLLEPYYDSFEERRALRAAYRKSGDSSSVIS